MNKILSVENLQISFQDLKKSFQVLRGITFDLFEGENLAIVGESGSGKSVLAKAITGLNSEESSSIDSGKIFYKRKNLLELSHKQLRQYRGKEIGMIFQDPLTFLNPTMKVGKQIQENLPDKYSSHAIREVLDLLSLVGITETEKRYHLYPHELSGGMRQRVMIAMALAARPKILIADEPTTALDVTIQSQILQLLKKIQIEYHMSILFITHNLSLIPGFCDRVLVLYAGAVAEVAEAQELFSNPMHPYTSRLIQAIPKLHLENNTLVPIEGSPPNLVEPIIGCGFFPRCPFATEKCKGEKPPLFFAKATHGSACWRHSEASHE